MLVAQWFERGLGSIVAPEHDRPASSSSEEEEDDEGEVAAAAPSLTDEAAADRSAEGSEREEDDDDDEEEDRSDHGAGGGFWSIIAPDPVYYEKRRRLRKKKKKKKQRDRNDRGGVARRSTLPPDDYRPVSAEVRSSSSSAPRPPGGKTTVRCVHCGGTTPANDDDLVVVAAGGGGVVAEGIEKTPPATGVGDAGGADFIAGGAADAPPPGFLTPPPAVRSPPAVVRSSSVDAEEEAGAAAASSSSETEDSRLDDLVLSAAKTTALSLSSPPAVWESRKNFLTLCASAKPFPPKKLKKFRRILEDDPSLLECRGAGMGGSSFVPDGFGPLHVASMAGNLGAATALVEFDAERRRRGGGKGDDDTGSGDGAGKGGGGGGGVLEARDLQGRTALHVAAEHGRIDVVSYLKSAMTTAVATPRRPIADRASSPDRYRLTVLSPVGKNAPVDLSGRTPLGRAAASKAGDARKRREELERELYEEGDRSVCGIPTPAKDRAGGGRRSAVASGRRGTKTAPLFVCPVADAELAYGYAEMPGRRIDMEDAICCAYPLLPPPPAFDSTFKLGLFGVFDGHGDGGFASRYLAENFPEALVETDEWRKDGVGGGDGFADNIGKGLAKASAKLDVDLRKHMESGRVTGGSTAVVLVVAAGNALVCANVGDCRCVLVKRNAKGGGKDGTTDGGGADDDGAEAIAAGIGSLRVGGGDGDDEEGGGKGGSADGTEGNGASTTRNSAPKDEGSAPPPSKIRVRDDVESERRRPSPPVIVEPLSFDHKPDLPSERSRIENAGLSVVPETFRASTKTEGGGTGDEGGNDDLEETIWKVRKSDSERLAVSRSFGDYDYKSNSALGPERQAIVAVPDVVVRSRSDDDLYVVLACDGVWDVMSNEDVGIFVHETVVNLREKRRGGSGGGEEEEAEVDEALLLPEVGDKLCEECLRRGTTDNMSVLIVSLPTLPTGKDSAAAAATTTAEKRGVEEEVDGDGDAVRALEFDAE